MSTASGKRRGHGEGSVYESPKGSGRWTVELDLGRDATGKRRRKRVGTGLKSVTAARKALRDAQRDLEDTRLASSRDTVKVLLEDFLQRGLSATVKADSTRQWYRRMVETHLIPGLGGRKSKELSADDVDVFLHAKAAAGCSRSTLGHLHGILSRALTWAERRQRVSRNVAKLVDTPQAPRRISKAVTVEQAHGLLKVAREDRHYALYCLGLVIPARPGELLGLAWPNIDFESGVIHFRQSLKPATDTEPMTLGALKNDWSRRSVLVSDWVMPQLCPDAGFVMAALRSLRTAQAAERLAAPVWAVTPVAARKGEDLDVDSDLVFRTEVGTAVDYANQRRSLRALAIKAGLGEKWTTRELRHTAVSILSHGGVPLETIADLAGHRDSTVTASVYRHNLAPVIRRNPTVVITAAGANQGSEADGS